MSGFRKALGIIRPTAWVITALIYLATVIGISLAVRYGNDPTMRQWPAMAQVAFVVLISLMFPALVLLIGYVYADAKRRGMRYVMWTLLAIFLPDAIGIILYFILRDPLPAQCPGCATMVPSKFTFCPQCGTALKPRCPQCGKAVQPGWTHCVECGTKLPGTAPRAA